MLSKNSHFGHSVFNTWKHFFLLWGGEIKEQRFGLMSVHQNLCPQCMCMNTHCSLCFFLPFLNTLNYALTLPVSPGVIEVSAQTCRRPSCWSLQCPKSWHLADVMQVCKVLRVFFFFQCLQEWCINIHLFRLFIYFHCAWVEDKPWRGFFLSYFRKFLLLVCRTSNVWESVSFLTLVFSLFLQMFCFPYFQVIKSLVCLWSLESSCFPCASRKKNVVR